MRGSSEKTALPRIKKGICATSQRKLKAAATTNRIAIRNAVFVMAQFVKKFKVISVSSSATASFSPANKLSV